MAFIFQFVNVVNYTDLWILKNPCIPGIKPTWSWCMIFLMPTPHFKSIYSLVLSFLYSPTLTSIHDYRKNHSSHYYFVDKVMTLHFNRLTRLVIALLPSSKSLLNSWLQLPSTVILEPLKIMSVTVSTISLSICHAVMALDAMFLVF